MVSFSLSFSKGESKEEFFYLVNKRGIQLNPAEVNQAYHHDSDFLNLVYIHFVTNLAVKCKNGQFRGFESLKILHCNVQPLV